MLSQLKLDHSKYETEMTLYWYNVGPPSSSMAQHRVITVVFGGPTNARAVVGQICYGHNPYPAKFIYLNCHSLEVVSRYRDPQLQVAEHYSYLFNFNTNICKSRCLDTRTFHSQ